MFFFVPVSNFEGADQSDYVYLYAEHGYYSPGNTIYDFTANSGFEEWAIPVSEANRPSFTPIPEPSAAMLTISGAAIFLFRRKRRD